MTKRETADSYRKASKTFAAITALCLIETLQAQSTWAGLCWLGGTVLFAMALQAASRHVVAQRRIDEAVDDLARAGSRLSEMGGEMGELGEKLKEFVNLAQTFAKS